MFISLTFDWSSLSRLSVHLRGPLRGWTSKRTVPCAVCLAPGLVCLAPDLVCFAPGLPCVVCLAPGLVCAVCLALGVVYQTFSGRKSLSPHGTCVLHVIHFAQQTGDKAASEKPGDKGLEERSAYLYRLRSAPAKTVEHVGCQPLSSVVPAILPFLPYWAPGCSRLFAHLGSVPLVGTTWFAAAPLATLPELHSSAVRLGHFATHSAASCDP